VKTALFEALRVFTGMVKTQLVLLVQPELVPMVWDGDV
jgi:hypothetical protein